MINGIAEDKNTPGTGWIMLGLILFVQTVSPMGYYGLSALAPFILEGWSINRRQFGMLVSAFSTGTFLLAFPAGIFTDRIGVRAILLGGLACVGTFISLAPWLPRYSWVLVVMFLAGIGYGLMNPAASKAVYYWFPPRRRGLALSIKQTSLPLCGAVSGLLLPPVSLVLGWRETWMGTGLFTLLSAVLAGIIYRDPPAGDPAETVEKPSTASAFKLLRHKVMFRLILMGFFLTGIQISWHNYIAVYLKDYLNMSVVTAGSFLAIMQASSILGRPALGMMSDTIFGGSRRNVLLMIGAASFLLGLWLALLPETSPRWVVAVIFCLFGFTGISWHGVHLTWMTEIAGPTAAGAASGLWICSAHLGFIVMGPIFGWIVDRTGSYSPGWVFTSLLSILAVITMLSINPETP